MAERSDVAAERAYRTTKERILRGDLSGGQLVSEVEVSTDLGVSRTPVHEAFLRLGAEQLLDLQPRRAAVVRPMTPSEVSDVLAMRQAIEAAAARQIFDRGGLTRVVEQQLAECLDAQDRYATDDDVDGFVASDDAFHATIVEASRNAIALHFYDHLRARQQRLRNLLLRVDPANLHSSLDDHRQLAGCLRNGDSTAYDTLLREHFQRYQGAI